MTQPDMSEILAQAQQMQAQLQAAQQEILQSTVTGEAGNGLVNVVMDGSGVLQEVTIKPEVVDPDDVETLQDLVLGAYNAAHKALGELAEKKMQPLSQGLGGLI